MIGAIEKTVASIQMLGKKPLDSFFKLLGGNEDYLVDNKDNLVSFISIYGATKHIGETEREEIVEGFDLSFASLLKDKGHVLEFGWKQDPASSPLIIDDFVGQLAQGAKKAGLDMPEALDGKRQILRRRVSFEETVLAVWTKVDVLNSVEKRADTKDRLRSLGHARIDTAAPPIEGLKKLVIKHRAAVEAVVERFNQAGIASSQLTTKQGLTRIREQFYPSLTGAGFQPLLPGEPIQERVEERAEEGDWSEHFPPALAEQVFVHGSEDISNYVVSIGDTAFGYVNMIVEAQVDRDFSMLVDIIKRTGSEMPWRVLWRVEGGVKDRNWQRAAATAFKRSNTVNTMLLDSLDLSEAWERNNKSRVYLSASFATWAPKRDLDVLDGRVAQMVRAIGNWAVIGVSSDTRDPLEGVCASVPGINIKTVAARAKPRLTSAFRMLPVMRPGSPWTRGSVMFHTPDGKPFYYELGSDLQTAWLDIIVGQQGSGKSALVNSLNLGALLDFAREGTPNQLPKIGIIDIGYSSRGLIEGIRDALPQDRKHEAIYIRWQNKPEHSVNPFDTPLGLREPLAVQADFLKTFVAAAVGAVGPNTPDVLKDIIENVIDEAYMVRGTNTSARRYEAGEDAIVDAKISELGIGLPVRASWWEVVDLLYSSGAPYEALCAQRYAVPTLTYLAEAAQSDRMKDVFGESLIGQEPALKVFARKIDRAVANFGVLSHETKFELHSANVISLDLSEVTTGSGELGRQKIEVMYLAARHFIGNEYYLVEDDFLEVPEPYRSYHSARMQQMSKQRKRLVYDEFHMTNGATAVEQQIDKDVRVCRKYDVQISLVSQLISDFSETLISLARSFFICSAGGENGLKAIHEYLQLSPTAMETCRTMLRGPTKDAGAPIFCIFDTVVGRFEHYLMHSMSPEELWANTTKGRDVSLKRGLERRLGRAEAWKVLCSRYPGGTAIPTLKLVAAELAAKGSGRDPIEYLIDELAGANRHA